MKVVLVGINSQYFHSNLAIRYLKAFNKDLRALPIHRNMTQKEFYEYIFDNLNIKGDIDNTLTAKLKYAYISQETKEMLATLNLSALADCFCKHDGSIKVQHLINIGESRAIITDANQILSANIEQSLIYNYAGVLRIIDALGCYKSLVGAFIKKR